MNTDLSANESFRSWWWGAAIVVSERVWHNCGDYKIAVEAGCRIAKKKKEEYNVLI